MQRVKGNQNQLVESRSLERKQKIHAHSEMFKDGVLESTECYAINFNNSTVVRLFIIKEMANHKSGEFDNCVYKLKTKYFSLCHTVK